MTLDGRIFQPGSNFTIVTHEFYKEAPYYMRVVATGQWYRKFGSGRKYSPERLPK